MKDEQVRLLDRIYRTQEGKDYVEDILKPMSSENYFDLLKSGKEHRDELIGFGNCLMVMINQLENAGKRLEEQTIPDRS
jgi:hypothetical protein